jgi:TP901 family phage tail tape measure protein
MASSTILAKMSVLISAQTAEFGKALERSQAQLNQFSGSVKKMAAGVGVAFGAFEAFSVVKSAVNSIIEFEHTLSTVKAITGATGKEFQQLKKSALDLGASTKYTATQVAELQVEYGRLGFTTKEILAATSATLDLATATGSDLAKSADVAGSTVRGFGLNAEETRRVVDVMAESFNKSALGLENFSEAMKYVAPVAAQAGLSVEETTAMLGTLADAGIRGSMAGTSLRKIISDLGGETGTLSEKLKKLADKGLTGAQAMDEVGRTAYASLLVLA